MKKFLLLFCAAVLVCSIMIVPAMAAQSYDFPDFDTLSQWISYSDLPKGEYYLELYGANDSLIFTSSVFPVGSDGYYNIGSYMDQDVYIQCYELIDPIEGTSRLGTEFQLSAGDMAFGDVTWVKLVSFVPSALEPVSPLEGIFSVFGGVGSWISGQLGATTSLFWTGESLTFLGVLSVCAAAIALILLLIAVVVRFLRFGG